MKTLEKIENVEPPRRRKVVECDFRPPPRSGEDVAKLEGVVKRHGACTIYDGLDLLGEKGVEGGMAEEGRVRRGDSSRITGKTEKRR